MAQQHLAPAQHRDRPAGTGIGDGQARSQPVQARGDIGGHHGLRRKSWDRDAIAFRAPPGGRSAIAMRDGAPAARGGRQLS
jgi:hypothetical protein